MGKKKPKKSGSKTEPVSIINLATAILQLIMAFILLYEKLKS